MKFWSEDIHNPTIENITILWDSDEERIRWTRKCAQFILNEGQAIINKYKLTQAQFNEAFPPKQMSLGIAIYLDEYGTFKRIILNKAKELYEHPTDTRPVS